MITNDIQVERRGPVGWVVFNRPEVGNAVRDETLRDLCEALDDVIGDPAVGAIVLAANGKNFLTGAELSTLDRINKLPTATVQTEVYAFAQGAARRLYHCPKPTIAAVQGMAITVGCELALACDFRIVTPGTKFQETWIRVGALPPLGGLKLLPVLVGLARAKEIALRGRPVDGEEAIRIGLASELVAEGAMTEAAQTLALELAALPSNAYREAKAGLHRGLDAPIESDWQTSGLAQATLLTSPEFRERLDHIKARMAKR